MRRATGRPHRGRRQIVRTNDALLARGIAVPAQDVRWPCSPRRIGGAKRRSMGLRSAACSGAWRVVACFLWPAAPDTALLDQRRGRPLRPDEARARALDHRRWLRREAHHRRRPAAHDRCRADPGARRRSWNLHARLRHRRRQGAARAGAVGEARTSHAPSPSTLQVVIEERVPFAVWQ